MKVLRFLFLSMLMFLGATYYFKESALERDHVFIERLKTYAMQATMQVEQIPDEIYSTVSTQFSQLENQRIHLLEAIQPLKNPLVVVTQYSLNVLAFFYFVQVLLNDTQAGLLFPAPLLLQLLYDINL